MKTRDDLKSLLALQGRLEKEATALEAKAAKIRAALGQQVHNGSHTSPVAKPKRSGRIKQMSLREAVVTVTKKRPLTKPEILEAVTDLGYQFTTDKPNNSLGALLYTKGSGFVNRNGKWQVG